MMGGPIMGGRSGLTFSSDKVNIVFDGNSLVFGDGSTGGQTLTVQLAAMSPINGQISITNLGVNGQTTSQMRSAATDVNGAWVEGKTNILVVWEGTNHMNFGASALTAYNETVNYIADRLALNPWKIVLMTTLPRRNQGATQDQTDTYNAKMDDYNARLLANYKTIGAVGIVDVRKSGSPFLLPDYLTTTFQSSSLAPYWASEGPKNIHLNNAGYGLVAGYVAQELRKIRPN